MCPFCHIYRRNTMNYQLVKYNNIGNGIGIRTSLFVTGCSHGCKGCFNQSIANKNTGEPFTDDVKTAILQSLEPSYIAGLSLLGGEPMVSYNAPELAKLCREVRELHPTKNIWVYSGFTYEQIIADPIKLELLEQCDVLVDGKFEQNLYSPLLRFRGSSNQRIIDIKKSLESGAVTLFLE